MDPLYVKVDERDNVAIVVNPEGLEAGACFAGGLTLREKMPQSHKLSLQDLPAGAPVVRYGETIGHLNRGLAAGSWVREEMIDLPGAPALADLALATRVPPRRRPSKATPSMATATRTARPAREICLALPPPSSVWRPRWTTPCAGSNRNSCRAFRMSMAWWP